MRKELIFYYIGVVVFFIVLIFSIRHIVNTNRIFVDYESGFNPVQIKWEIDKNDSTLRIKDPLHIKKDFYLIEYSDKSFLEKDSILYANLESDSLLNKGNLLNIQPPFYIWKEAKNDTLKVFKNGVLLKFVSMFRELD